MRFQTKSFLLLGFALGTCVLASAQTTYPGADDTTRSLGKAFDHAETKLSAPATDTDTVFSVDDATKFGADAFITFCIGTAVPGIPCTDSGEISRVSASSGTAPGTITVDARNIAGSTPQNHATGDTVHCTIISKYHNFVVDAIAATQAKVDTLSGGGGGGYSTLEVDGAAMTQRAKANLLSGTGCTLTAADNSGAGSSDVTISCPGGSGYAIQVDGVPQTAEPTLDFTHGAGIALTPSIVGSVLQINVAASGSGSGIKATWPIFSAAGCAGSSAGAAIDLPITGGPAANCYGSTLRFGALDFTSGSNQTAQIHFMLPGDWTAASTVTVRFNWFSTVGASSSTIWSAKTVCPNESNPITGTVTWNAAGTVTTANNTVPLSQEDSVISSLSAAGCSVLADATHGNAMWIQIQRTDSAPGTVSLVDIGPELQRTY